MLLTNAERVDGSVVDVRIDGERIDPADVRSARELTFPF